MKSTSSTARTVKTVQISVLIAVVVVLQLLSSSVLKIGAVSISLVLVPIVAGGIVFGPRAGAILGAAFGIVTVIGCVSGTDAGGNILFNANPFLTVLLCMTKATLCGFLPALLYHSIRAEGFWKDLMAAVLSPCINTGVFLAFTLLFFRTTLVDWAAGSDLLTYVIVSLVGLNFLTELLINLILSPAVARMILALRKSHVIR